jgi:hypothetical protein
MSWTTTAVLRRKRQWAVQVESSAGEQAELRYGTEAQARYFAAVLALGPSTLPRDAIVRRLRGLPRPAAAAQRTTPFEVNDR